MRKSDYIKAYTLAEVLIVMSIIGVLAVITVTSMNTEKHRENINKAKVMKAIEVVNNASVSIMQDNNVCPDGKLITGALGQSNEYGIVTASSTPTDEEVLNEYKKYIKFLSTSGTPVAKGTLAGGTTITFAVISPIGDCPNYTNPENGEAITVVAGSDGNKPKCWATITIDANGSEGPNTNGEDRFTFGIGENGVNI